MVRNAWCVVRTHKRKTHNSKRITSPTFTVTMVKFKVKPSQQENWRYIAFELISEANVSEKDVVRALTSANLRLYGEVGTSEENLWLIEFDLQNKRGIVRCSHKTQQKVIAAMTAITKINEQDAVFNILGVSGTIKKTREKYFS